ncbi:MULTISPECIES: hypothetical protein [unclassified Crossiella]|uniref:hypothetical protein n=1 Tax=unclassified Crossiella TaxID=2620835 RepID=UPI001FFF370D|nr:MULTISPECIES: hypothetical protein [unclassified Crossiella]MCK2239730.1 hypothetical protein [Crossiella sp. S99.2]MCK2252425.1 hypothetical protein [Crossiella sp. S99.1]
MKDINARLDRIRGSAEPLKHNARTIAALTSNPGCARRAVLDGAAVDKQALAEHLGFAIPFGMSNFALARGNAFEAHVKANGCAQLLRLLREQLGLPLPEVSYDDLNSVAGHETLEARHLRSRQLLAHAADSNHDAGTLFDHPLLRIGIGGRNVYLEPDLIAFQLRDRFHVVEIKSFPIIDRQADGSKVAAAAIQSSVYVLALRDLLTQWGADPELVSHQVILVCPEDFSNWPTAALLDVRKQLTVVRRQLARLTSIDTIMSTLPVGLTLDLRPDETGKATRPVAELVDALGQLEARYAPECLATCEMGRFCRAGAQGQSAALGRSVQEDLAGIDTFSVALGLADGTLMPGAHQLEAAQLLRLADALRQECLGGVA